MKEALSKLPGNDTPPGGIELEKYISLLHILKGQEEFVLNRDGVIIGSNLEAVNVTGYEEYEVLGKHISLFYPTEESGKAREDLEKAINFGQIFVTGLRIKKRGVAFWAKMKIEKLQSIHPDSPCFKIILQDTTHRALSKARIRTIKDEYLTIFNNPFVGTFKFRMDNYRLEMCNQKTLEIAGKQQSFDLGFDSFFNSVQQFHHFISLLKEEKKVEGFKFLIHDNGNPQDNWGVISARYFEAQGFAEGVLLDISEQHTQMLELQRVNAELDNFTYHASHDLRAPLTSMMGLVNLGMKESCPETVRTYLEMIQGRIGHMDILLKDLISVSYNYRAEVKHELFDFKAEVDSILKLLENPESPLQISVDVQQDHDFKTDSVRMRTILRNLLSNAFKYYNPDAKVAWAKLKIQVDPGHASIQLKDNGIGIDWSSKDKIYDMFFRATDRSTGTGLGLYIVKSMVDKLRGQISLESTLNVGTTFLLVIPNKREETHT